MHQQCQQLNPFVWSPIVSMSMMGPPNLQRWLLLRRRMPHKDVWDQLRGLLASRTAPTGWRHVYSHVGVVGNEHVGVVTPRPAHWTRA